MVPRERSASGSLLQKTEMADKQRSDHGLLLPDAWLEQGAEPSLHRNTKYEENLYSCYRLPLHFCPAAPVCNVLKQQL